MQYFKKAVEKSLKEALKGFDELNKAKLNIDYSLEIPPGPDMGDFAFPCFSLSGYLKKSPNDIAQDIARKIILKKPVLKVEIKGPYVNFFIDKTALIKKVIENVLKNKKTYGSSGAGKGKKALIEHTSINPNASPHVGRARNAIIGDSIVRILRFQGYKTRVHYFVNDIGKQIAMLAYGCRGKKKKFEELLGVYVRVNKELEKKLKVEEEVLGLIKKLEKGDKKVRKDFKTIVDTCIKGQADILSELGIKYDRFDYESEYLWKKTTKKVLEDLKKTGRVFTDEQCRQVLDLKETKGFEHIVKSMKAPVLVLTRADRTSLYILRDLAYTIDKLKIAGTKKGERNIVVLGEDHKLYFQQLKAALSLMGKTAPEAVHYSFILLSGEGKPGKMSTRKGNLVLLEHFMEEALKKAKQEIKKRNPKIPKKELEELARIIGYGALKYSILKVSPDKNVLFSWSSALNFEGETAPYIQYAHARICSILRKHKVKNKGKLSSKIDYSLLDSEHETRLVRLIAQFEDIVRQSSEQLKPHLITGNIYEIAKAFNEFYHKCPILQEKEELKNARLLLASCVKQVLANGLAVLGIDAPEKM